MVFQPKNAYHYCRYYDIRLLLWGMVGVISSSWDSLCAFHPYIKRKIFRLWPLYLRSIIYNRNQSASL